MIDAKGGLVALAVVGLGVSAYYGNEAWTCHRLETDFLDSVSSIRSAETDTFMLSTPDLDNLRAEHREIQTRMVKFTYVRLYKRCGKQTAEAAHREASYLALN